MNNLKNIEVFNIETREDGLYAHISFQNLDNIADLNNGYDNICVPIKPRLIQQSSRDNMLCDQSVKNDVDVVGF